VTGKAEPGADIWDIVAATFPAGTMTGAPKIRAIEIIEAIETRRRGLYAGAFGWVDFGGDADLALCIRTALHDGQCWSIRASAGIVADSQPLKEWRETLAKMAAGYWAITGKEIF
jgi:anthranilate synthase component 1